MKKLLPLIALLLISVSAIAQNVKTYELPNGGLSQPSDTLVGSRGHTTLQFTGIGAPGTNGSVLVNSSGAIGALSSSAQAAAAAHNSIANGISYDPRDPAYGAICGGYNTFTGDGVAKTFSYTIPFTGSSATDNTNFMVFYEPSFGGGSATILTSSDFTVTGVNSGSGTITLNTAPPSGNTLLVVHDDGPGFIAASAAQATTGGYVSVPHNCTIYTSRTLGTQLAEGAQLIGQSFTPNYGFQGQGTNPIMHVIAPTGFEPAAGFNISSKTQQFFEGFEMTTNVPGHNQLGFLLVPVLIGVVGSNGAGVQSGVGVSPGITIQYMTLNSASVGFGAPIGGTAGYIFSTERFNNFTANNAGIFGPLSDLNIVGNVFSSNGGFGSLGSAGGLVIGPIQGAPGVSGAGRVEFNRFEFNLEGVVNQAGALISFQGNEYDGNTSCGLDLRGLYNDFTLTGEWFRGNGNGGGNFPGNGNSGQDAHVCAQSTSSASSGVHFSNSVFQTNYSEGATHPLGTNGATSPQYVLDMTTTGSWNNDIEIQQGSAPYTFGNQGAAAADLYIFRNGRPARFVVDTNGQAVIGKNANGSFPSQSRGLPSNQWGGYYVYGDAGSYNNQLTPLSNGYAYTVGNKIGVGPTYFIQNDFSHFDCDVVNNQIMPNAAPTLSNNPLVTWMPSLADPTFGAGFFNNHLTDTNACHLGGLTWLATPRNFKVYGQATGCVKTGTWTNDSSYTGYYGTTSNTNGDNLACTTTTNGGPIYLWYKMNTASGGTFNWQLDSATTGAVTIAGASSLGAGTTSVGAVRIPVQSTGSHTVTSTLTSTTSASNTVTIEGIGTPPGKSYDGSLPMVVMGGQVQSGPFPSASTAFNNAIYNQVQQTFADGLQVGFADVQNYVVASTADIIGYPSYPSTQLYASGQLHVANAFDNAIQGSWNSMNAVNPRNYGASCNAQYMVGNNYYSGGSNCLFTTAGSADVQIQNYVFQPGVATQNGGGDVGKVFSMFGGQSGGANQGKTTYVASVNTATNTATLGEVMALTTTSCTASPGTNTIVEMGGYPSNPNDPSTAQDDTLPIERASVAATVQVKGSGGGSGGGGKVFLPDRCLVHNLSLAEGTLLEGNMGGGSYDSNSSSGLNRETTKLYCSATGFNDDVDSNGKPRNTCINISASNQNNNSTKVQLKNFNVQCGTFPYPGFAGLTLAGIGTVTGTALQSESISLDHVVVDHCMVGLGVPFGWSWPVTFTAAISGTTMTVSAITSSNFLEPSGFFAPDSLALGRTITGVGVTAGTIITAVPRGGQTGTYTISPSQTVGSETITSPSTSELIAGISRFSTFMDNAFGALSDFSDWAEIGDLYTGNYDAGLYMGPRISGSGNAANRILGGRFEESSAANQGAFVCDACGNTQLTGVQFQFNGGYAAKIYGGFQSHVVFTGGMMQGSAAANAAQDSAHILLGGATSNISISGMEVIQDPSWGGPHTSYLFETATGSSVDNVSWDGGDGSTGYNVAPLQQVNGSIAHYKQNVPGIPVVDTFITPTTAGITLSSKVGGIASSQAISGTTTTAGTLTLSGLPAVTNGWTCLGGDVTLANNWPMSATTSTSCALAVTTSNTDKVYYQGKPTGY